MATSVYKCRACGKEFSGGRKLGDHYAEYPDHRPVTRAKSGKPGSSVRSPVRRMSTADLLQAAVDKLAVEINAKRQLLADVERTKAEITALENQRTALQRLLPSAKTE